MKKLSNKEWVAEVVASVFVAYALFGGHIINLFQATNTMSENANANINLGENIRTASGVTITDLAVGSGAEAKVGDTVSVNYILTLADGTVIQNSKDFGSAFAFTLGAGEVIPGWEQGFDGMKVGGIRTIIIPPDLAYGYDQVGPIPPNSTLVLTIELLDVESPEQATQ